MSGKARILLTGALIVFVISAVSFGADSMLARSPANQPSGYQPRVIARDLAPVRVILPASADPARPPEPSTVVVSTAEVPSYTEPALRAPGESKVEGGDGRGAAAAESHRRHLERKSRRTAARVAAQQSQQPRQRSETAILAFDGDDPSRRGSY